MKKLIVLTGPTGIGKTALSVALAKNMSAEIISADSMQVYRGMDIGTAKIRTEEMQGVPHHLIDILDATEPFDVARFQALAKEAMAGIHARGHVPMLVGGTGFYIQSVVCDIDFSDTDDDPSIRRAYEAQVREGGETQVMRLHALLSEVDPVSAESIDAHNVKRVIRALEYHDKTGRMISAHNAAERQKQTPYDLRYMILTDDREVIYRRINERVDAMMAAGFLQEVQRMRDNGVTRGITSMQGLGYRELYAYLEGEMTLERAVTLIKQNTRHFAKRQLTWFRREKDAVWFDKSAYADEDALFRAMCAYCEGDGHGDK